MPSEMLDKTCQHQGNWICAIAELPTLTPALEATILSVCTARLGRLKNDQSLIQESLKLYTQGLSELQRALKNPKLMYSDETLAACMSLTMYEVTECPSKTGYGYIYHHMGCARLIELRGAEAHNKGLGHQVFLAFRIHGVC